MRGFDPLAVAQACLAGGARLLQVRRKGHGGGSRALHALTRALAAAGRAAGATVILNDRADLAVIAGADGVHVGQHDLPIAAVRAIVGPERLVGVSTHTVAQIDEALDSSADYIAVGPVFSTATKDTGYTPRGLGMIERAVGRGKPIVAIGGITLHNAAAVMRAGVSSVAVISGLLDGGDVEGRVRAYLGALS